MKFLSLLITLSFALPTFAEPSWQPSYEPNDIDCVYSGRGSDPSMEEVVGTSCSVEGETLTVYVTGSAGYECGTVVSNSVVCCGEAVQCPQDTNDRDEYP